MLQSTCYNVEQVQSETLPLAEAWEEGLAFRVGAGISLRIRL